MKVKASLARLCSAAAALTLLACVPEPGVILPDVPTPSPTPTRTPDPTSTPAPPATPPRPVRPTPTPTPLADQPLSPRGPWLAFTAAAHPEYEEWAFGLFAANADGSGLTQLVAEPVLPFTRPEEAVAPGGSQLAFIASSERFGGGELSLSILTLPGGDIRPVTPLTPPDPAARREADPAFASALLAVEHQTAVWSPQGTHLAFVSAHEGPSADLYMYNLFTRLAVRLGSEPGQAAQPVWSPDGRYIAYGVVEDYEAEQSARLDEIWVAWGGGGSRSLAEITAGADDPALEEDIIGWSGPDLLLVAAWDRQLPPECNRLRLREINVWTGERRVLWPGSFSDVALDPASGVVLIAAGNTGAGCQGESGLYLRAPDKLVERVSDPDLVGPFQSAVWSAARGVFEVKVGEYGAPVSEVLTVSAAGRIQALSVAPGLSLAPSPDGELAAWYGQRPPEVAGLWIGPFGELPVPVFAEPVSAVTWSPDSQSLFFFRPHDVGAADNDDASVYVAVRPTFIPTRLTADILPGATIWMPGPAR